MINLSKIFFRRYNTTWSNVEGSSTLIAPRTRNDQHLNRGKLSTIAVLDNPDNEKKVFYEVLPYVIKTLTSDPTIKGIPDISSWIQKIFEYNLTGGKYNRGITTVLTYKMLENEQNISEESLKLARVLGWCTEILQCYFITQDDIIDNSFLRRGVPCWFQLPDVGLAAINDGFLINGSLFQILKQHFSNSPCYTNLVDLYTESLLHSAIGQHLDIYIPKKKDYSQYTIDNYNAIVKYKSTFYTYKLPIALGLNLVKQVAKENFDTLDDICIELGNLFQMQDDFIDCYGDVTITGKVGTDIQQRKCTWLAVTALQRCSPSQRTVFTTCYGSEEPAHIERIKWLYNQLLIPKVYKQREKELYTNVTRKINALKCKSMRRLYQKLLDTTFNRKH